LGSPPPLDPLLIEPVSEFLRPLYMSQLPGYTHYGRWAPHIRDFALSEGTLWRPAVPLIDELTLAAFFRDRRVRIAVRNKCPEIRGRVELGAGEAEAAAVAVSRGFTFLVDDQAAVNIMRCLYPDVPVLRTCGLLVHAVKRGFIHCDEAAGLFNDRLARGLHFYVSRKTVGIKQYLRFRCNPPNCVWEEVELL
jgi:predicted nucleic acid-binding protein